MGLSYSWPGPNPLRLGPIQSVPNIIADLIGSGEYFNMSLFGNVGVSSNRWIWCPNEVVLEGGDPNHLCHLQGLLFLDGVIIAHSNYFTLGSENYSVQTEFDLCWKLTFSEKLSMIFICCDRTFSIQVQLTGPDMKWCWVKSVYFLQGAFKITKLQFKIQNIKPIQFLSTATIAHSSAAKNMQQYIPLTF